MTRLVDVRLHGPLADKYGSEHRFVINSPREAIAALDANYPGFRREFLLHPTYGVLVDDDWRDESNTEDIANSPIARQIDFVPMVEGRLQMAIVPLLGLIGVTGVTATILAGVISIGLLIGVSLLLTAKPKTKTSTDAATSEDNYMFSGPENVTEQGAAIPLIYGQCYVGSVVVSAGLEVAEGIGGSGNGWSWSRASAYSIEDRAEPLAADVPFLTVSADPDQPTPPPVPPGRTWPPYRPENA